MGKEKKYKSCFFITHTYVRRERNIKWMWDFFVKMFRLKFFNKHHKKVKEKRENEILFYVIEYGIMFVIYYKWTCISFIYVNVGGGGSLIVFRQHLLGGEWVDLMRKGMNEGRWFKVMNGLKFFLFFCLLSFPGFFWLTVMIWQTCTSQEIF